MTRRITIKELETLAGVLSRELGFSNREIEEMAPGTIRLDSAYGGFKFVQMQESGGQSDFLGTGYIPKRDLWRAVGAAHAGMVAMRRALAPVAVNVTPDTIDSWRYAVMNGYTYLGLNDFALNEYEGNPDNGEAEKP